MFISIFHYLKDYLYFITHPDWWYNIDIYSKRLDTTIISLLNDFEFKNFNGCIVTLGPLKLWVKNYPVSAFILFEEFHKPTKYRPSRRTMRRAYYKLIEDLDIDLLNPKLNHIVRNPLLKNNNN